MAEASRKVRDVADGRSGDPRDLFWDGYRDGRHSMSLAAEMIVPDTVEDDFGAVARPTTTFLRYEVGLGYAPASDRGSVGRITLQFEHLRHITRGDAHSHLRFPHSKKYFRDNVVLGERRGGPFISTEQRESGTVINVHGDGGSRGKPQPRPSAGASRTILSSIVTNDQPTILAARKEMQSWRRLALEPSALRSPDSFADPRTLGADGAHLAATLFRIANDRPGGDETSSAAAYARVAGRLADLSGLAVDTIEVEADPVREALTLFLGERGGLRLPARALSEGTLRFLALCVLLEDPAVDGLICMEEPENGISPANLSAMLALVRDLAVDPTRPLGEGNGFRQVIVNTHSPGVVQLCRREEILLAENRKQRAPDGTIVRALSILPLTDTWRADPRKHAATEADIVAYLTEPPGRQLRLPTLGATG